MTYITEPLANSRQFQMNRRVALSDTDPSGRLRLDACARYLQDVAAFDAIDADISEIGVWVLRQNTIYLLTSPIYGQQVNSKTYLTGSGRAWVERTSIISDFDSGETLIQAKALWVLTGSNTGAPISVPQDLYEIYGPLALQRKISIRDTRRRQLPDKASLLDWQIRYSDQDILKHLNNATYLEALEEIAFREGIKLEPHQEMMCNITYKESTSWADQSDTYYTITSDQAETSISLYFSKNGVVRTSIVLSLGLPPSQ